MKKFILILLVALSFINLSGQGLMENHILAQQQSEQGVSFDVDYQAVLDEATTQGYTLPSPSVQSTDNDIVIALKGDGNWSKLEAFWKFATDGDSDFASINWIDPTGNKAVEVGAGSLNWGVDGVQGDGTNYLDMNVSVGGGYLLDDCSVWIDIITEQTTNTALVRGDNSGAVSTRLFNTASFMALNGGGSSPNRSIMNMGGTGFFTVSRDSSTNVDNWKDGSLDSAEDHTSLAVSDEFFLFENGSNRGNAEVGFFAFGSNIQGEENNVYEAVKNAPVN